MNQSNTINKFCRVTLLTSNNLIALCFLLLPSQWMAFTSNYIFTKNTERSIREATFLLYQVTDQPPSEQRISPSLVDDITDQVVTVDFNNTKQIKLETEEVEDNNDWISATRTLGSLILQQNDETKDTDVDVFGRPLNLPQIDQFGLPKGYDAEFNNENDGWQSSLARYLLQLKSDEEDNRERISKENKGRQRGTKEDQDLRGRERANTSINSQLNQVSSLNEC